MPAMTAPLLGLALGAFFAWIASDDIARAASPAQSRGLPVVAAFGVLVYAPAAAYFLAFAPDWSFAYVVDTERLPSAVEMALVLTNALSLPLGFAIAGRAAGAKKLSSVVRLATVPVVAALAILVPTLRRLSIYATYAQYHGDFGTERLTGSSLGYALVWVGSVVVVGAGWTLHLLKRMNATAQRD